MNYYANQMYHLFRGDHSKLSTIKSGHSYITFASAHTHFCISLLRQRFSMSGNTVERERRPYFDEDLPSQVRDPGEPAKRIILICDGTWNDATAVEKKDPVWTNPQRLADCIMAFDKSANMAQSIIYLRGVGTTTSWLLNRWEAMFGTCELTRLGIGEGNC